MEDEPQEAEPRPGFVRRDGIMTKGQMRLYVKHKVATFDYKEDENELEDTSCGICLSEF